MPIDSITPIDPNATTPAHLQQLIDGPDPRDIVAKLKQLSFIIGEDQALSSRELHTLADLLSQPHLIKDILDCFTHHQWLYIARCYRVRATTYPHAFHNAVVFAVASHRGDTSLRDRQCLASMISQASQLPNPTALFQQMTTAMKRHQLRQFTTSLTAAA